MGRTSRSGIWAPGGPTVDGEDNVLVAVGDGPKSSETYPHSESVIKLSPTLEELDYWAPDDWPNLDRNDIDIGSVSPTLLPDFGLIFQGGKNTYGYLPQATHRAGAGGDVYQIRVSASRDRGLSGGNTHLQR